MSLCIISTLATLALFWYILKQNDDMEQSQIVQSYSDEALEGIIKQLTASGAWPSRLQAARAELRKRMFTK